MLANVAEAHGAGTVHDLPAEHPSSVDTAQVVERAYVPASGFEARLAVDIRLAAVGPGLWRPVLAVLDPCRLPSSAECQIPADPVISRFDDRSRRNETVVA